jgi:hypothetical protein
VGLTQDGVQTIPNTIAARKPNDVIAANAFRLILNSIVASFADLAGGWQHSGGYADA